MQRSQVVQSGEVDMDDLCTQLKNKAAYSGAGAVILASDIDAILGPEVMEEVRTDYMRLR